MSTLTFEEKQIKGLIKKFHTLLGRTGGGTEAKEAILSAYGVASSRDLSAAQLIEICNSLDRLLNPQLAELDKHRKRLMASIGAWLRAMNVQESPEKLRPSPAAPLKGRISTIFPWNSYAAFMRLSIKSVKIWKRLNL
jgi:hypothetical protein